MAWFEKKRNSKHSESEGTPKTDAGAAASVKPRGGTNEIATTGQNTPVASSSVAVFISYRRTSALIAEHIHEKYCAVFDPKSIFLDRADIEPGAMFPDRLRDAVAQAAIILVVIGRDWISAQNERTYSRRLDEEDDWVRQELVLALQSGKKVIPVLAEGAKVPTSEQLPLCLRPLIERNAFTLSMDHFGDDVAKLISTLGVELGESRASKLRVGEEGPYAPAASIKPYALSDAELQDVLKVLPQWRLVESDITDDPRIQTGNTRTELMRDFLFESFEDAIAFMSKASGPIDAFGHHPRWQNVFRTVTVAYSTWDIGHRPSDRDQKSAQMLERIYREFMAEKPAKR